MLVIIFRRTTCVSSC